VSIVSLLSKFLKIYGNLSELDGSDSTSPSPHQTTCGHSEGLAYKNR
jgi:hypothetical protein